MQTEFARNQLRCPACRRERTLELRPRDSDAHEVREGAIVCAVCGADFPLHRGVGHLMSEAPAHVEREAAGLARFAEYMRSDGWDREKILQLPNVESGYWYVQSRSMDQLLDSVDFASGKWLLDVGSNTCWASNRFAAHGLQVAALDISTAELQGLYTSDYFIDAGSSYFERVLGSMYDMPLASESFDYVFCCEVLHHNDTESLRRTFTEAYRVLKPGGKLVVINETIKTVTDPIGVHTDGVEQFEGYEHAFWALRYRWEAIRAGFQTRMLEPCYHWFFDPLVGPRAPSLRRPRRRALHELRSHGLSRRAYLSWLNHVRGGVQLNMIATKPSRPSALRPGRGSTGAPGPAPSSQQPSGCPGRPQPLPADSIR